VVYYNWCNTSGEMCTRNLVNKENTYISEVRYVYQVDTYLAHNKVYYQSVHVAFLDSNHSVECSIGIFH